jgi:hypothetical protein
MAREDDREAQIKEVCCVQYIVYIKSLAFTFHTVSGVFEKMWGLGVHF